MAEAKTPQNLYRSRREALGWSREHAAEEIGVSDDKLERIEKGKQLPNPQDVLIMSEVYRSPELCNIYCSTDCEIGRRYVPRVPDSELPGIILRLLDSVYEVENIEKSLVRITADEVIEESEVESLANAQYILERLSVMIEALQLCIERKISRGEISLEAYRTAYEKAERRIRK